MPSLRPLAAAALGQIQSEGAPDDETFWAYVRLEFELTPEFTNLVSVVRGHFTKANREIAFNEATRLNQLSAPLPDLNYQRETRRKVAGFIGASAENIALLRNTTEGVTTALSNWPLKAGDEILTSSAEHGPFYDTLAQRAARDRVTIRQFHYPAPVTSAQTILDAIDRALTVRTRLVMIGQVVLLGQINSVRPIADLVHSKGAKLLVDGVLGLGHVPTDVKAMDCDFYAAGFHKFACGPRAKTGSAMAERNHTRGSSTFRKKLRVFYLSPMRRPSLPLLMLTVWQIRLKLPHGCLDSSVIALKTTRR